MDQVKAALLGCGYWGNQIARVLGSLKKCKFVAAADLEWGQAELIGRKYGPKPYKEPSDIYYQEPDAVIIATPTTTHFELAMDAIERDVKFLLVEKPMTSSSIEAETLLAKAAEKDAKIMVGFIERFNAAVIVARSSAALGEIGKIVSLSSKRVSRRPKRIGDVGVVKDLAIHEIDVARFIVQAPLEQVYAITGNIQHKFEDFAEILLRFQNGVCAFIESNWFTPFKIRQLTITGDLGYIEVDYLTQTYRKSDEHGIWEPLWADPIVEPLKQELNCFLDSVLLNEQPHPSGQDGLKALWICESILTSAKAHKPMECRI